MDEVEGKKRREIEGALRNMDVKRKNNVSKDDIKSINKKITHLNSAKDVNGNRRLILPPPKLSYLKISETALTEGFETKENNSRSNGSKPMKIARDLNFRDKYSDKQRTSNTLNNYGVDMIPLGAKKVKAMLKPSSLISENYFKGLISHKHISQTEKSVPVLKTPIDDVHSFAQTVTKSVHIQNTGSMIKSIATPRVLDQLNLNRAGDNFIQFDSLTDPKTHTTMTESLQLGFRNLPHPHNSVSVSLSLPPSTLYDKYIYYNEYSTENKIWHHSQNKVYHQLNSVIHSYNIKRSFDSVQKKTYFMKISNLSTADASIFDEAKRSIPSELINCFHENIFTAQKNLNTYFPPLIGEINMVSELMLFESKSNRVKFFRLSSPRYSTEEVLLNNQCYSNIIYSLLVFNIKQTSLNNFKRFIKTYGLQYKDNIPINISSELTYDSEIHNGTKGLLHVQ
jgi:hypothetical protein